MVTLPGLNPACSFRGISSIAPVMRIMATLQNTLLGIESNVTPLQLLQSARYPFLVFGQCCPVLLLLLFPYVNEQRLENVTGKLAVIPVELVALPSRPDLLGLVECQEGALVQVDLAPLRSVQSTLHLDPAQMS